MMYDPEDYHDAAQALSFRAHHGEIYALEPDHEEIAGVVDEGSQQKRPGAWVRCWMYVTDDQVTDMMDRREQQQQRHREEGW